jgi:hypothetical protein
MRAKNILKAAPISLLVMGGLVLVATPASADWTNCPAGSACLWTGESYPGSPNGSFQSSIVLSSSTTNKINSISNAGNSSIAYFYDGASCAGGNIAMNNPARGGQSRDPMLSNGTDATSTSWANKISCAKFIA